MTTSVAQLLVEKKIQPKVESSKLQAASLTMNRDNIGYN
jgi:hypothetical protein